VARTLDMTYGEAIARTAVSMPLGRFVGKWVLVSFRKRPREVWYKRAEAVQGAGRRRNLSGFFAQFVEGTKILTNRPE